MKHIRKFESYRIKKHREDIIKESVLQVNDIYKVKTMIDIPQSLINSYIKKVKDTTGKNLRQFFGDVDIAEEIIKYINLNFLDVDKIPGGALMGGGQTQPQAQVDAPVQDTPQSQPQAEVQTQVQPQAQAQTDDQTQEEGQPQVQVQSQVQSQPEEFEEPQVQSQESEEDDEEEEENNEELPL